MRLRRDLLWLLALSILIGSVWGSAASLGGLGAASLGAGAGAIASCDGDGVAVSYTTQGGNVTAATVTGIADPACEGAQLSVATQDAAGTRIAAVGPQSVQSDPDGNDQAVTLAVTPADQSAEGVAAVSVQISGP